MIIEAGIDLETTGLKVGDHRIIESFVGLYRNDKLIFKSHEFINPKRSISAEAQAVHKITAADVAGKPDWETLAPKIQKVLAKADLYVIQNAEFDLGFLEYEFKRVGLKLPERPVVDTMQCTWATPNGKKPSLRELCFACGVEYAETDDMGTGAHAADYDVDVMMRSFFNARKWGFIEMPAITPRQQQPVTQAQAA